MKYLLATVLVIAGGLFSSCTRTDQGTTTTENRTEETRTFNAVAELSPKSGSQATGTVNFDLKEEGMVVTARVENATPGSHGIHIHENGDCSADDASSAGDHFNPTDKPHGGPNAGPHHVGDMGNIEVGQDGVGTLKTVLTPPEFSDWEEIVGKSIILHEGADDLTTQPSGDSGKRVACGVIVKPPLETAPAAE